MTETSRVQVELLLPHQINAALAERAVVYVPLGSIEYHSHHLPVGLDGLNAHGICTRAALATGGLVLPTLYLGVGGGHTDYPWTIMAPTAAPLADLLEQTLHRLAEFGVATAVLFTGHFAAEQLDLIDTLAEQWNRTDHDMRVIALSVNRAATHLAPDHAGVFETTLLSALWPDRVQLDRIPRPDDAPSPDPVDVVDYDHRHDPDHPLWGVMGPDPRRFQPQQGQVLLDEIVSWTCRQIHSATTRS